MRCGVGRLEGIERQNVHPFTWVHLGYSVWYVVDALVICLLRTFLIPFSPPHVHIVTTKRSHTYTLIHRHSHHRPVSTLPTLIHSHTPNPIVSVLAAVPA